jgi:drug/metabolite transporter (DMT)-like permease
VAGSTRELVGAGAVLAGTLLYAVGPFNLRGPLVGADSIGVVAVALTFATIVLTPFALLSPPASAPSATAVASIVVLGVLCSAAALVLFAILVAEVGGGRAMVITYVSPIVAVALGVSVLGESIGAGAIAGLLLILAGSWLATDGRLPPGLARRIGAMSRSPRPARTPLGEDDLGDRAGGSRGGVGAVCPSGPVARVGSAPSRGLGAW